MKQRLQIFQYGSEFDPIAPNLYSPSDWVEISFLKYSLSERRLSAEALSSSTFDLNTFPSSPPFDSDAFQGQPSKELLPQIYQELERRMEEIGIDLPLGISVEYFTYHVLLGEDEAGVLDSTFLTEVLADLQQPGHIVSCFYRIRTTLRSDEILGGYSTSLLQLAALQQYGSNNPLGVHSEMDKIASYPYFYVKDVFKFSPDSPRNILVAFGGSLTTRLDRMNMNRSKGLPCHCSRLVFKRKEAASMMLWETGRREPLLEALYKCLRLLQAMATTYKERLESKLPASISGNWLGLVSSARTFCLARLPTHEFFRAGRQAGRTGTVEEVPQRAAATTLL
uniref:Apocytochrome B, mitochondrial n=1 Tax=Tanacetum cinerariifolium TaxID=118510 RepID=A0A6L2N6T2_TANCI|nr:apocytochrome B, mitochondrial [Tanacetum cinerariifolium]